MFSAASSVPREGDAQRTKRSIRSCFSAISSGEPSSCLRSWTSACSSSGSLRSKFATRSASDRRQRDEIADQPAARMRDDADAGVARQCVEQFDGVVDRAVAHRAVLEGVDAIAEQLTQRLPLRLRVLAQERAEAAACGRSGAVDEDENWLVDVEVVKARGLGRCPARPGRVASSQVYRPGPGLRRLSMMRMRALVANQAGSFTARSIPRSLATVGQVGELASLAAGLSSVSAILSLLQSQDAQPACHPFRDAALRHPRQRVDADGVADLRFRLE